jgi:hypothetical protein
MLHLLEKKTRAESQLAETGGSALQCLKALSSKA